MKDKQLTRLALFFFDSSRCKNMVRIIKGKIIQNDPKGNIKLWRVRVSDGKSTVMYEGNLGEIDFGSS